MHRLHHAVTHSDSFPWHVYTVHMCINTYLYQTLLILSAPRIMMSSFPVVMNRYWWVHFYHVNILHPRAINEMVFFSFCSSVLYGAFYEKTKATESQKGKSMQIAGKRAFPSGFPPSPQLLLQYIVLEHTYVYKSVRVFEQSVGWLEAGCLRCGGHHVSFFNVVLELQG